MRKLTITRAKSFVGCACSYKVYIADPASREIIINGTPARQLGALKNGQTVTYEIDNTPQRMWLYTY